MNGQPATYLSVWKSLMTAIAVLASVAAAALPSSSVAQTRPTFPAFVLACDAYVQMRGSASGAGYPPECRGLPGVAITAYNTNGERLDQCTSDDEGVCMLAIGYNGVRIYEQDPSAIPEGYRAESNVQRTFTYTEFGEIAFHNYSESAYPQRDGPTATLRVHTRICPERYMDDNFFEDCNSGLPETDQWIFGNDGYSRAGRDGDAILRDMHAGDDSVIIGGQSESTGDVFFYCSQTEDPSVRIETSVQLTALYDGTTRDFAGIVDLGPGDDITCDWYQIPLLDRGLWDTLVNPLVDSDPSGPSADGFGTINLVLQRCVEDYIPETITGAKANCDTPENSATVSASSTDGTEYVTSETDSDGVTSATLTGEAAQDFWITLDGHADAEPDLVACYANVVETPDAEAVQIQQYVLFDGAGWTISGFGDDSGGYTCTWYLVPTSS